MKAKVKSILWDLLKVLATVISAVGLIVNMYEIAQATLTGDKSALILPIIACFWFLIVFGSAIFALSNQKERKMLEATAYAEGFHSFAHDLRDFQLELKKDIKSSKYKTSHELKKQMITDMKEMMVKLASNLSLATKCEIRTCLKLFDFTCPGEIDRSKMNLITFVRNNPGMTLTATREEHYHKIKVSENTDFEEIFMINEGYKTNRKHFFYKENLKLYEKELKKKNERYKNSNINWRKEYNTTIVLPIRCVKDYGDDNLEKEFTEYDLIGFLCVDSLSTNAFSLKSRGFIINYLSGIADILYVYFDKCLDHYALLKGRAVNVETIDESN
ncbi:MAG: hypothetical protein HY818_03715 [Acetobacterium woodii]|nr:hypothetical protein [Acetobacterium woodii]